MRNSFNFYKNVYIIADLQRFTDRSDKLKYIIDKKMFNDLLIVFNSRNHKKILFEKENVYIFCRELQINNFGNKIFI
jgi:hypothetical protein